MTGGGSVDGPERKKMELTPGAPWFVWMLDNYFDFDANCKTRVGELINAAKYHGDQRALHDLETSAVDALARLRRVESPLMGLSRVSAVMAVPDLTPKAVSLPLAMASCSAKALGIPDLSKEVRKIRPTAQAKFSPVVERDAYEVSDDLTGHTVLIVDDVFRSGCTLESVALQVRASNAMVVGFCLAKAVVGMGGT